mmetsp:Transcript_9136/g.24625  ORF Transcript_9136/g.24625 Transcript_9136/m.24625 type:complete len:866 (-) Transcript_9136:323-2920(-)
MQIPAAKTLGLNRGANLNRAAPLRLPAGGRSLRSVCQAMAKPSINAAATTAAPPTAASEADLILKKLRYDFGKLKADTPRDAYNGAAFALRERLIDQMEATHEYWRKVDPKFTYYLSAEFLMGRSLMNTVLNLGLQGEYAKALNQMGYKMEEVAEAERDAALGNGGLGRLAACFLDSMATLDLPGWGYGIRYKYGMFKQLVDRTTGYQNEVPDVWLTDGNPWEVKRNDVRFKVSFGGKVDKKDGKSVWTPAEEVWAVAYDNPVPGFRTPTCANLRLWDAQPLEEFDLGAFNAGEYDKAMLARERADAISAVLYPNDATPEGKELRLKQQYFFVTASLQDVLARFKAVHGTSNWDLLPEKACFQLNDTHPTMAMAELTRLLVDVEGLSWEQGVKLTSQCLNYTNHTVMPEALEKWPVKVLAKMLPRNLEIIEIIDEGWQKWLKEQGKSDEEVARMAIIHPNQWNKEEMLVNMAYLAVVCANRINGVAAIHSEIVKDELFNDFYKVFPSKFQNKTNGVTPRRWLNFCNPELSALITEKLGSDNWVNNLEELTKLRAFASDKAFQEKWQQVKRQKKVQLAGLIKQMFGDDVNLDSLFDVQIKRIHEYKRQHLNVFSIIHRYKELKAMTPEQRKQAVPRVCIFGGKAASSYDIAKRIVRLINQVGNKLNSDPDTKDLLRVYFIPDYNVSLAEKMIPGAELSQHISTAGTEASGTSNMKFQMNGSLILGTWDGATIEIAEETGVDEVFIFGVRAHEIHELRKTRKDLKTDPRWDAIMEDIKGGMFGDAEYFKPLVDSVHDMSVGNDWFLLANDFADYMRAQAEVDAAYKDQSEWTRRSIMYTAGSGKFSSDRTVREYAEDIWKMKPVRPQ